MLLGDPLLLLLDYLGQKGGELHRVEGFAVVHGDEVGDIFGPEILIAHEEGPPPPGVRFGPVVLVPPSAESRGWHLRQDLTELFATETNFEAEDLLRAALAAEDAALAERLSFDTEGGAVEVAADREEDIRATARVIERLARNALTRRGAR